MIGIKIINKMKIMVFEISCFQKGVKEDWNKLGNSLLKIINVSKNFGGVRAVKQVSFQLKKGEIKGLIGPNGAGKSTLLNIISAYEKPSEGQIEFKGIQISSYSPHKIVQLGIARTFQTSQITKSLTVLEGVMLGAHAKLQFGLFASIIGSHIIKANEKKAKEKAMEIIDFVGLNGKEKELSGNLSYGLARRLEIGRALATDPEILLLDEPVAGLNTAECEEFKILIQKLSQKASVLVVEHNMNVVMNICDNVVVLNFGEKVSEGTTSFIQKDPKVIACYLGEEVS